jgi:hypothetical protein
VKKITKNARKMTACFISFEENSKSKKEGKAKMQFFEHINEEKDKKICKK